MTEALERDTPLERDLEASRERHGAGSAAELCQAVMARALSGHGPPGAQDWDDDRTVVVVKVFGGDAVALDNFAANIRINRRLIPGLRNSMTM